MLLMILPPKLRCVILAHSRDSLHLVHVFTFGKWLHMEFSYKKGILPSSSFFFSQPCLRTNSFPVSNVFVLFLCLQVVNLLIVFANAACQSSKQNDIFEPYPTVVNPQKPEELALSPEVGIQETPTCTELFYHCADVVHKFVCHI